MNKVCAFAPATMANLNVGFDVLGMALASIGDHVEVAYNDLGYNRIVQIVNDPGLPYDVTLNVCSVVIHHMQQALQQSRGVDIWLKKGYPAGSGWGSSSASSAAAAVAFNQLSGGHFTPQALVHFAAEGERVACGVAHLDNVAPAVLGGLVLVNQGQMFSLPVPSGLTLLSFYPHIIIKTADSRSVSPRHIPLGRTVQQMANMGQFVSALYQNDAVRMGAAMQDLLVEPSRKCMIPFFDEMRALAMANNALCFGISGSGPSVFAFCTKPTDAQQIVQAFEQRFAQSAIETQYLIEPLQHNPGAFIVDSPF